MSRDKFEVYIEHERFSGETKVYIFQNKPNGTRAIVTDLSKGEMKTVKEYAHVGEPTFRLGYGMSKPFLQAMANELHVLGIKAEKAPVLENEMDSVKYHLEDMRKLVFTDMGRLENIIIKEVAGDGKE